MSFTSYEFQRLFREVFDHAADGREPSEEILSLKQGSRSAAEFTIQFWTLAAQTGCPAEPLKALYYKAIPNSRLYSLGTTKEKLHNTWRWLSR